MSTVRLVATKAYSYAERTLKVGDVFEASDKDAKLLIMIGSASKAPSASYRAKVLDPVVPEETRSDPNPSKPKRQYRRRDLVPET